MSEVQSVLFLCDYQAPYGGNFIASLCCLGDAVAQRGLQAVYAFPAPAAGRDWYRAMAAQGRAVSTLPAAGARAVCAALLRQIDESRAAVLHVHFGYMLPARLAALLRPRLMLVLHQHSDFSAGRRPGIRARLRRAGLCCIDALLGRRLRQIYVNEAMPRGKNGLCIRNALAPNRFTDELWDRERTRRALGLPDGTAFALLFGWSPHIKGVDVAAEALRLLHAAGHTEFVLGVVGGRAYPEERLRAYIAETTGCTGQEAYLRFLPPLEDVFRYHRAADVMLSASRSEAFPYSILEALSVGTPCVVSDIGGTAWAAALPTTQQFRSGDPADCAAALRRAMALRQDAAFSAARQALAAEILHDYDIHAWAAQILEVYGLEAASEATV